MFSEGTPVTSYGYENRSALNVRSFPTKKVLSFFKQHYQTVAVDSDKKPSLAELGIGRGERKWRAALDQIVILTKDQRDQLDGALADAMRETHAVPPGSGTPALDFHQVRVMHQALSREVRNKENHREKLPDMKRPEIDFHQAVAAMGQYQKLMRALALAIDIEVAPIDSVAAASNIPGVTPTWPPRPCR